MGYIPIADGFAHIRPAINALPGQIGKWRVNWKWYVAVALVFPVFLPASIGIYSLSPGALPPPVLEVTAGSLVAVMIILMIILAWRAAITVSSLYGSKWLGGRSTVIK